MYAYHQPVSYILVVIYIYNNNNNNTSNNDNNRAYIIPTCSYSTYAYTYIRTCTLYVLLEY